MIEMFCVLYHWDLFGINAGGNGIVIDIYGACVLAVL